MADAGLSPVSVLRQAMRAVPAVKWALGVGGVLAAVALIPVFRIEPRFAFVGILLTLILMGVLVVFARASALPSNAIARPALVFTWFALLMFMTTSIFLFTSVFFGAPVSLQNWLTGQQAAAASAPAHLAPPDIPVADSGFIDGGSSPNKYCDPILASLRAKYPDFDITMTLLPEDHRSEYNPFKHDLYRYQCSFKAATHP